MNNPVYVPIRVEPSRVVSSEVMGCIQRNVFDHPGMPLKVLVDRLSRRFSAIDVIGAVNAMSRSHSPSLVLDESDRVWPYIGGRE